LKNWYLVDAKIPALKIPANMSRAEWLRLGKEKLDEKKLERTFEMWWENFKSKLDELLPAAKKSEKKDDESLGDTSNSEILEELLELTRNQVKLLRSPETLLPPGYFVHILRDIGFSEVDGRVTRDLERSYANLISIVEGITPEKPANIEELKSAVRRLQRPIMILHDLSARNRHGLINS
jgi:hypothetical protein